MDVLVEAQNKIFYKTRRAQANWVVAGMDASNIIETLPGFVPSGIQNTMGIVQTGVLNGRWTIYKDPYIPTDKFLVGHKGVSFLETGMVYAPYVPLFSTGTVTLDDFIARKGLGTLYGKKIVNPNFYCLGLVTA